MCMTCSHLVLVNHKGELSRQLQDLLEVLRVTPGGLFSCRGARGGGRSCKALEREGMQRVHFAFAFEPLTLDGDLQKVCLFAMRHLRLARQSTSPEKGDWSVAVCPCSLVCSPYWLHSAGLGLIGLDSRFQPRALAGCSRASSSCSATSMTAPEPCTRTRFRAGDSYARLCLDRSLLICGRPTMHVSRSRHHLCVRLRLVRTSARER